MIKSTRDITVIVPAFNEERSLAAAVESVLHALGRYSGGLRVLIINDGSSDATGDIAQKIAARDMRIQIMTNSRNRGLGYSFRHAFRRIRTEFVTVFPADNDMSAVTLKRLVDEIHAAELICGYMMHTYNRGWVRRLLSRTYIVCMNLLFGLRLRYYNGPFLCSSARLRSLSLRSNGLDVFAEIKIRLLRSGCSFKEIPFEHTGRKHGVSKAVTVKSVIQTVRTTGLLVWDIYVQKKI